MAFAADADLHRAARREAERDNLIAVNHPLSLDGASVFLLGHGYAPGRDGARRQRRRRPTGPVVFLPEDSSFASFGVIKVPDAGPERQLGFEGVFLPTYGFTMERGPFSAFPTPSTGRCRSPYRGDLGLDTGAAVGLPLDKDDLDTFARSDKTPSAAAPAQAGSMGRSAAARRAGSISFDRVDRWVAPGQRHPGQGLALGGVLLGIVGLMGSLFIRPRRAWVGSRRPGELGEVDGLDRRPGGVPW